MAVATVWATETVLLVVTSRHSEPRRDCRPRTGRSRLWWLCGGDLRRAIRVSRSQPEMGEDLFNDLGLVSECDDPPGSPTLWAEQQIGLMNGRKV